MRAGVAWASLIVAASAATPGQVRTYTNSIGMELVLIEPGTMVVGRFQPTCPSPVEPPDPSEDPRARWTDADYALCGRMVKQEATAGFTVTIERAYYIGKYEVTQGEWTKVVGTNPSVFQGRRVDDDAARHPVESVTWDDAQRFVRRLNQMEKTTAYRLPTEFEWEYAARAGAPADPAWDEIREMAWEQDIEHPSTHLVGTKKPNAWGLHDMLGNVWEWVEDYYNERIFADPVPPSRGSAHVVKGAGFLGDVKNTVYSTHGAARDARFDIGLRVVRAAIPGQSH